MFFSIFIAIVSGAAGVAKWRHLRRKNRIDSYYGRVLEVQNTWPAYTSVAECHQAIQQLRELRKTAFQLLIDEKLEANESFRIFITLLNDTLRDLREKKREICWKCLFCGYHSTELPTLSPFSYQVYL